jgi:hypothetical protein
MKKICVHSAVAEASNFAEATMDEMADRLWLNLCVFAVLREMQLTANRRRVPFYCQSVSHPCPPCSHGACGW